MCSGQVVQRIILCIQPKKKLKSIIKQAKYERFCNMHVTSQSHKIPETHECADKHYRHTGMMSHLV